VTFSDVAQLTGCRKRGCELTSHFDVPSGQTILMHGNHPEGTLTLDDSAFGTMEPDRWGPYIARRLREWGQAIHDYEDGKLAYLKDVEST
jgi:hypothetical protein